jgi:hypothetical protein
MARHGDAMLPARTRVLAPGKRKDNLLVIQYKSRDLDPAFAKQAGDGGNTTDGGNPTDGGTPTDDGGDDWGGADGWEGEDGGAWEGAEGAEPKSDPAPEPPAQPPAASPKTAAPKVFTIDGTGLGDRGDLCRPH